jgi:signal transduction histidine kinase/ActR/RegA family two-component response regulator
MMHEREADAQVQAVMHAARAVASSLDLDEILRTIVTQAREIAATPVVWLYLFDAQAQVLRYRTGAGVLHELAGDLAIPLGQGLSGHVAATGEPLNVVDARNDPRLLYPEYRSKYQLLSYLGLPVRVGTRLLGVLVFNDHVPREYAKEQIAYLEVFAQHAAVALENARLYQAAQGHAAAMEERVRQRTAELEKALQARAEFLARMSHELRTPLNFVLGFAELLRQPGADPLTARQVHFVERIQEGGRRLLDMVNDILDLSETQADGAGLRLHQFLLSDVVQEALQVLRVQAVQKGLRMVADIPPRLSVVAERRKLLQVLIALVSNAVKFTAEGGEITVRACKARGESPQDGETIEICVADDGIGIEAVNLERVFRGFEQVDGSARRHHGGIGIGLSLARILIELHGGRVWAESAGLGQGSRFYVCLPVLRTAGPQRIVVVEDDTAVVDALTALLRRQGYAVAVAETGKAACAAIEGNTPDLVLLDLGLPDMNGASILQWMRNGTETRHVPVLVLTGRSQAEAEAAIPAGANEFLTKPFSPSILLRTIDALLTTAPRDEAQAAGQSG